jgi:hypothetical protein
VSGSNFCASCGSALACEAVYDGKRHCGYRYYCPRCGTAQPTVAALQSSADAWKAQGACPVCGLPMSRERLPTAGLAVARYRFVCVHCASPADEARWLAATWRMIEACAADTTGRHRVELTPSGCRAMLAERKYRLDHAKEALGREVDALLDAAGAAP